MGIANISYGTLYNINYSLTILFESISTKKTAKRRQKDGNEKHLSGSAFLTIRCSQE